MPGCAPQSPLFAFCPDEIVTRRSMAGFLERGVHGALTPPPVYTGRFDDVLIGSFNADYIQGLTDDSITAGCSADPPLYCPDFPVTRAQMAVLVWKGKHGAEPPPPCTPPGTFADVPCPGGVCGRLHRGHLRGGDHGGLRGGPARALLPGRWHPERADGCVSCEGVRDSVRPLTNQTRDRRHARRSRLTQAAASRIIRVPRATGRSFNGRTTGSGPVNRGSSPCLPARSSHQSSASAAARDAEHILHVDLIRFPRRRWDNADLESVGENLPAIFPKGESMKRVLVSILVFTACARSGTGCGACWPTRGVPTSGQHRRACEPSVGLQISARSDSTLTYIRPRHRDPSTAASSGYAPRATTSAFTAPPLGHLWMEAPSRTLGSPHRGGGV